MLTAADDLNSITQNGIYWYLTDSVPAHAPYNNSSVVEVHGSSSDTTQKLQRVTRYGVVGQSAFRPLISASGWLEWAYNITNANMQSGTVTVSAAANGDTEFTVKFPNVFSSNPNVYVGVLTSRPDLRAASVISRTTSGFTGSVHSGTSAAAVAVFWTAVSP